MLPAYSAAVLDGLQWLFVRVHHILRWMRLVKYISISSIQRHTHTSLHPDLNESLGRMGQRGTSHHLIVIPS